MKLETHKQQTKEETMDVEQGNPLSVVRSLERLECQKQEKRSSSVPLLHQTSTSTQAKASLISTLVRHFRGKTFLRLLSLALLVVMITTSSLQLLELLTGTRRPLQVLLLQPRQPGQHSPSLEPSEPDHSLVMKLLEVPYELQMLMPSDTPASALASTPHQT